MSTKTIASDRKDRARGAIMGTLIGDALGVGCQWYYDPDELTKDFGYITDYVSPLENASTRWADVHRHRRKEGVRAGDLSQTGQIITLLLESIAEKKTYDQEDFTSKLDGLLNTLDGTLYSGRITEWEIRDIWRNRVQNKMKWDDPEIGSLACTSGAALRIVVLAARYPECAQELAKVANRNILLTHRDPFIVGQSLSWALIVQAFIQGIPMDELCTQLHDLWDKPEVKKVIHSFDSIDQFRKGMVANNPKIPIDPPHLIGEVYGKDCQLGHLVPSAYYLTHRFPDDFESAVLAAINGGGNGMARASLTGGLVGARVGLGGIPERFIQGLSDHEYLLEKTENVCRSIHIDTEFPFGGEV